MIETTYSVPLYTQAARSTLRPIFRAIFHLISHVIITGKENVPRQGPYLVAINHVSLYDPPLAVAFWPTAPEVLGAEDVWHRPGQNILAILYRGIPVRRGEYDRQPLERMLQALRSGFPVLLAPEGHRSHRPGLNKAQSGIAYLVEKYPVDVIPVGIVGTTDDFWQQAIHGERPRVFMHIGVPLHLPPIDDSNNNHRAARQQNADLVMARIAALLPPEYRGVYANHPFVTSQASR
ncbi:MAG: 1-acyl-sn-glycerol-3-phosphate acyltransferase [Anaerolineales bacterium]|nr:1-acyl-sn-glycerol-3-phosphate acyltransferase [Anaerolineales bacterium]